MSFEAMKAAAENGNPQAQAALGYAYDVGEGVEQNLATAIQWYRQAADQGHADAQFNLAEMYRDGAGVAQSNEEALAWYTKAGMQGHSKAQYNIAMMYVSGEGVAADNVTAYAWLALSATGDAEGAAQARDIVGQEIGDQITAGQALAAQLQAEISKATD
ncbi:tetratricopeptide repeat protein [Blastopirellula retiformator]|uniref:Localization factor PodJL n=1 Tax=Blastopirellula retiformator TaxID=2527970 RepID=A0A5C5VAG6_9BACT|nr:tetratricopeptide repeat protein [Blastopirellula retiformator]TWT34849.1 Localization factor PodJL [Blastopirellula retiformator]